MRLSHASIFERFSVVSFDPSSDPAVWPLCLYGFRCTPRHLGIGMRRHRASRWIVYMDRSSFIRDAISIAADLLIVSRDRPANLGHGAPYRTFHRLQVTVRVASRRDESVFVVPVSVRRFQHHWELIASLVGVRSPLS